MDLNEYQKRALETAAYPNLGDNLVYPAMGLAGEAGEFCDKIKKYWRNTGHMNMEAMTWEQRKECIKELGDILWYVAAAAKELGTTLNYVAWVNIHKLNDRRERGVIKSEGDNR